MLFSYPKRNGSVVPHNTMPFLFIFMLEHMCCSELSIVIKKSQCLDKIIISSLFLIKGDPHLSLKTVSPSYSGFSLSCPKTNK